MKFSGLHEAVFSVNESCDDAVSDGLINVEGTASQCMGIWWECGGLEVSNMGCHYDNRLGTLPDRGGSRGGRWVATPLGRQNILF